MICIIKSKKEPKSLEEFRNKNKNNLSQEDLFDDLRKDELRKILIEDQGYLCCYCMKRINLNYDSTKIEHYKPQKPYYEMKLDFKNLFIACTGKYKKDSHCDTKKGNNELHSINLLTKIEKDIIYEKTGTIKSENEQFNDELESVLNLNLVYLKKNRETIYNKLIQNLKNSKKDIELLKRKHQKALSKNDGKYVEFRGVYLYFISKKLRAKGVFV